MQEPFFFSSLYFYHTALHTCTQISFYFKTTSQNLCHLRHWLLFQDCSFFFFFQFDVKLAKKKLDLFFYWPCRYMADVRLCCPVIFVYPVRLLRFEIRSRTSLLEYTQPAKHNHMMLLRKNCNKITRQIWKTNEIGFCCAPS